MTAFRERMAKYRHERVYPTLPDWPVICFYNMSKRRGEQRNWYSLPYDERRRLMAGHAKVGREYAGKIKQLITGSSGLDDAEWGVTLFARDTFQIKAIVYQMRFDEVSARLWGLRRILHRPATAARRIVPPVAALILRLLLIFLQEQDQEQELQGWVAEWSNAHAWKACLPKGNQGSNPCPSAPSLFRAALDRCVEARGRCINRSSAHRLRFNRAPRQHLEILAKLYDAGIRQDAPKIRAWINKTIATQNRTRINHRVTSNLRPVADNRAEFRQARRDISIRPRSHESPV